MIRRINLWGGPGVGKTATAYWLFSELKIKGYDVQFSEEACKRWACQGRPIISMDQLLLTALQVNTEDEYLRSGTHLVITDCPVMISYVYAHRDKLDYSDIILDIGRNFEKRYPSVNIFIERSKDIKYQSEGRYETEDEAKHADKLMYDFVNKEYRTLHLVPPEGRHNLLIGLGNSIGRPVRDRSHLIS